MIKVLHVIDRLKRVSGIASAILNYYKYMDTEHIQFDFLVVDSDPDLIKMVHDKGGEVYTIKKLGLTNINQVRSQISAFFSNHGKEYQIVHSSFYHIDFLVFPEARRQGIHWCISHSHNTRYSDSLLRSIRNQFLCRMSRRAANQFIACSEAAARFQFGEKYLNNGKVYILKNAIDVGKYKFNPEIREKYRDQLGLSNKYVIGHVGRFEPQKNHGFIIDLFSKYAAKDSNAILLLVGVGVQFRQYYEMAEKLGLSDKIQFLGSRDDVPNILQAFDCYIFPSLYEGLGISLIEAQAAGLPCIASNRVPIESKATKNVVYLDLDDSYSWIENLEKNKTFRRHDTFKELVESGYEVHSAVVSLERYYESLQ